MFKMNDLKIKNIYSDYICIKLVNLNEENTNKYKQDVEPLWNIFYTGILLRTKNSIELRTYVIEILNCGAGSNCVN